MVVLAALLNDFFVGQAIVKRQDARAQTAKIFWLCFSCDVGVVVWYGIDVLVRYRLVCPWHDYDNTYRVCENDWAKRLPSKDWTPDSPHFAFPSIASEPIRKTVPSRKLDSEVADEDHTSIDASWHAFLVR